MPTVTSLAGRKVSCEFGFDRFLRLSVPTAPNPPGGGGIFRYFLGARANLIRGQNVCRKTTNACKPSKQFAFLCVNCILPICLIPPPQPDLLVVNPDEDFLLPKLEVTAEGWLCQLCVTPSFAAMNPIFCSYFISIWKSRSQRDFCELNARILYLTPWF